MSDMLLLSDPDVADMPVRESHEPLVDMRTVSALRIDHRLADARGAYAHVRASVLDRLVSAQTLLPAHLRMLVIEGYRPLALQARYFSDYLERLRLRWPDTDEAVLCQMTSRYVSPPDVAPHVAGAAVDLTLCTADGCELWMGTEVNDTEIPTCHTDSEEVEASVRLRRQILGRAMRSAGFVNYQSEWWHWSYGDRYWACLTGVDQARYGPIETF